MSYAIDVLPDAAETLATLPVQVAELLYRHLESRLAPDPSAVSQPSHFPYPIDVPAYKTELEFVDVHYYFHVMFRFAQDEKSLHIIRIGVMRV